MSKAIVTALVVGVVVMAGGLVEAISAGAAELLAQPMGPPAAASTFWCGPCGCLHVGHAYHRELRSTYGLNFDPRNFDQTQPYYFLGPVRAYSRYWCDAVGWR
jgi:hypothetical protein